MLWGESPDFLKFFPLHAGNKGEDGTQLVFSDIFKAEQQQWEGHLLLSLENTYLSDSDLVQSHRPVHNLSWNWAEAECEICFSAPRWRRSSRIIGCSGIGAGWSFLSDKHKAVPWLRIPFGKSFQRLIQVLQACVFPWHFLLSNVCCWLLCMPFPGARRSL